MTPGPNLIRRIPASRNLVKFATINSGNTCGMRSWTDGRSIAPMLPESPWLRIHPATGELFWSDETEEVAEEEPWEPRRKFAKVPFAEEPDLADYRRALASGMGATRDKLFHLRLRFWWAANDPFRQDGQDAPRPEDFAENLEALAAMMDTAKPEDALMVAEAWRQLGRFDEAAALLNRPFSKDLAFARRILLRWTDRGDTRVRELRDDC